MTEAATSNDSATQDLLARAKGRLAEGTLTAQDLDELARGSSSSGARSSRKKKKTVTRQRLMYVHSALPSIRSPLLGVAIHEPVPGSVTQIDPLAPEPSYNSVFDAVLDGWRVIHFPQQLAPFDDREIDIMGYEFVLEKLEAYEV